ncbi:MAG: hypothetical protein ATN35_02400 [Epulopiscium sp. Nele67-Bin004]|nr:MAG: hypothetical protein ATN35_02400 [Epulopiscium sp. Nele67-Bin004]
MNKNLKLKESGFTLLELIVVIAVIGMIAAVVSPSFLETSNKMALQTDIQSAKSLQQIIDIYTIEGGQAPANGEIMKDYFDKLVASKYLEQHQLDGVTGQIVLQLGDSKLYYDENAGFVKVKLASGYSDFYEALNDDDQTWVIE